MDLFQPAPCFTKSASIRTGIRTLQGRKSANRLALLALKRSNSAWTCRKTPWTPCGTVKAFRGEIPDQRARMKP